ncbi:MAG: TRAP transporter large permease [Firmicutes bacterium]|nr:TRAP transporter large permease [Bacillota bacterium]
MGSSVLGICVLVIPFILLLLLRAPVAFALGVPSLLYVLITKNVPVMMIGHRMAGSLFSFVLLALPAFLLSGKMLNTTGVTKRLLDFAISLVGHLRGGLGYANALASMMFATMSGTAIGDAGGLGAVEMEMMTKAGYSKEFSAGITAASSIVGPIIPPSVTLVVYAALAEISVGRLFMAGLVPGVLMGLSLMTYIWYVAHHTEEGQSWPVFPRQSPNELWNSFKRAFLPLLTPVIIVVGIVSGIVTPTEAAVLAIDYALLLGLLYREVSWKSLWETLEDTVIMTGSIMLIFAIAGMFGWLVTIENIPTMITNFILSVTSSKTGVILLIDLALLLLGCFLDTTAALLLVTPVFLPLAMQAGIDPVHLGIAMTSALMLGIITPPFGICLFVVSDVAELPVAAVTKASLPYLLPCIATLVLISVFPEVVLFLPNMIFGP